ncbi:hypothetical protein BGZ60DRAFT_465291 [Tricladium varicosporioides]|nr:hypothetical protein BGZ60DRAFT_465291 [Hymenoscyphus varicosporioides]
MARSQVDRVQQHSLVVWSVVMTSLAALTVTLRVISRMIVTRKLATDDWIMIAGLIFTGCYLFEIIYGLRFGIGLHGSSLTLSEMESQLKLVLSIQLTYPAIVSTVKISILCFYLRLATNDKLFRRLTYATIIFIVVFFLQTEIVTTLQCFPIQMMWDLTGQAKGHCINSEAYFYFVAVFNILLDICVLILPIKILRHIQRPTRDKIVLFAVFSFGALACIASMIRLYTIRVFTSSKDKFYDGTPINIWSMIEINVAIICASVPALKPLFSKSVRERTMNSKYHPSIFSGRNSHPMIPLSDHHKNDLSSFRDKESGYKSHGNVSINHDSGSQDQIIPSKPGIEA